MTLRVSRRRFLATAGAAAGILVAGDGRAGSPPKESGLSSEGLLVGHAGFQPRTTMPLPHEELPGFLSRDQLARHHADYARLVERLHDAEQALGRGEADSQKYGELRRTQVATANGVLLHELYFTGLAATKVEPPRHIAGHMNEHMGPWESWRADFRECALVAKAWAALVYDPYDDRWHNVVMDSDDDGVWVGANPLVVCDVSEHAFAQDYQRREDYVTHFLDHVDWEEISRRYRAVDRM
jgi:superoxide dismutase, Fe-Mn family